MNDKCSHGYFTHSPSNLCPWCFGFDATSNHDVVPVVGHGAHERARQEEAAWCQGAIMSCDAERLAY